MFDTAIPQICANASWECQLLAVTCLIFCYAFEVKCDQLASLITFPPSKFSPCNSQEETATGPHLCVFSAQLCNFVILSAVQGLLDCVSYSLLHLNLSFKV